MVLDAYIRVSSVRGRVGDTFISPSVQRDRIAAWAQAQGHRIGKVHDELDESGGTVARPKLQEVMRRIEAGETGGVVVFKLDRFGRTLVDSLALIDRIERARGTFASVSDGFDLSSDSGRLVLRIMLSLAEFELDRIRANWREARGRAVARGIHVTAIVPFGYQRRADSGLEAHPENAPLVKELFVRRAVGAGWSDLRGWLEGQGATTQRGREGWTLRAMRDILHNDVYLGIASHGEFRREGAHDALTDEVTWRRAQRRGQQTTSRADHPALLGGLLRCSGCRYVMRAATRKLADGRIVHDYRCRCGAGQSGICDSPATATGTDGIENLVVDEFFDRVVDMRARAVVAGSRLADLAVDRDRARAALDAYAADPRVQAILGMDSYVAGLKARQDAYQAVQAAVDAEHNVTETLPFDQDAGSLKASWPNLETDERRRLLASAIDCVFVRRRASLESLDSRTHICWRGTAPPDLPSKGRTDFAVKPFLFTDPPNTWVALAQNGEPRGGERVAHFMV